MNDIKNYREALYHVKRGFLIIGLTGFTGSGCSTVRKILEGNDGPKFPGYDQLATYHSLGDQKEPTTGSEFGAGKSQRNRRIYDKLERTWKNLDWEPFKSIKVSTTIFIRSILRSLENKNTNENLQYIRALVGERKDQFEILRHLWTPEKPGQDLSEDIIQGYELANETYKQFRMKFNGKLGELITLMQDFGDDIRSYGTVMPDSSLNVRPAHLFVLPEALRRLIKAYRYARDANHFVVDAFRNPFEIEFFKWRYSEFYLLAILRDKRERWESLDLLVEDKEKLEKRESKSEKRSKENIREWIISQDIEECLTKADFYVENPKDENADYPYLKYNLIKLMCLAKSPGCIPPTQDERSMQMAMTARQMSGCISRRVGAAVINEDGYLIGFGWNDPPRGQPPCSLRTSKELVDNPNPTMFSKYEMSEEFRSHIRTTCYTDQPFCFRHELSAVKKTDDGHREFTRALHAEENALFQAIRNSGNYLDGAILYTTDQPCTLCGKKAYHLGIARIVFIQDYPGIATDQTLQVGDRQPLKPIEVMRFQGITGSAYFKLFSSLMPEKDIIHLYEE